MEKKFVYRSEFVLFDKFWSVTFNQSHLEKEFTESILEPCYVTYNLAIV